MQMRNAIPKSLTNFCRLCRLDLAVDLTGVSAVNGMLPRCGETKNWRGGCASERELQNYFVKEKNRRDTFLWPQLNKSYEIEVK